MVCEGVGHWAESVGVRPVSTLSRCSCWPSWCEDGKVGLKSMSTDCSKVRWMTSPVAAARRLNSIGGLAAGVDGRGLYLGRRPHDHTSPRAPLKKMPGRSSYPESREQHPRSSGARLGYWRSRGNIDEPQNIVLNASNPGDRASTFNMHESQNAGLNMETQTDQACQ